MAVSQNFSIVEICDFYLQRVDKSLCVVVVFLHPAPGIFKFLCFYFILMGDLSLCFSFSVLCAVLIQFPQHEVHVL